MSRFLFRIGHGQFLMVALCFFAVRALPVNTGAPIDEPPRLSVSGQEADVGGVSKEARLATVSQVLSAMLDVLQDGTAEEQRSFLRKIGRRKSSGLMPIPEVCKKFEVDKKGCDRVRAYLDFRTTKLASSVLTIHTKLQSVENFQFDNAMGMSFSTFLSEDGPMVRPGGPKAGPLYWADMKEVLNASINASTLLNEVGYWADLKEILEANIDASHKLSERGLLFSFGDNGPAPCYPTIQKSRELPSSGNDVLLNLNSRRHWGSIAEAVAKDKDFSLKQDRIVWRGSSTGLCNHPHEGPGDVRMRLATKYYGSEDRRIDVGFSKYSQECVEALPYMKDAMSLEAQLDNKFLLALQGNDKATGLNWMLASNSVVFMPEPTIESWILESRLVPWKHYVPLRQDLDDLSEQLDWAIEHPDKAEAIALAGRKYLEEFMDEEKEFKIEATVLTSYMQRVWVEEPGINTDPGVVVSTNPDAMDTLASCDCIPEDRPRKIRAGFCSHREPPPDLARRLAVDASMYKETKTFVHKVKGLIKGLID